MIGNTVNVVKRLEDAAEPDSLYISESIYHFGRGGCRIRELKTLSLRGIEERVQVSQLVEPLKQPNKLRYRSMGGLETHRVGCEGELRRLNLLFRRSHRKRDPLLALITGEAGVGKSRLLMEFVSQTDVQHPQLTVMSSRALQQTKQFPFYLWKELWSNRFDPSDDDLPNFAREKIIKGVRNIWAQHLGEISAIEDAHFLGEQIGVHFTDSPYLAPYTDDAGRRRERSFAIQGELFSRAQRRGLLILVLDDLQWGDRASLDLVMYLLDDITERLPMLILGGARLQIYQLYPELMERAKLIRLEPLPVSEEIVRQAYPALWQVPSTIVSKRALRVEGNPYFLGGLVKKLVHASEEDMAETENSRELPPSLQMLLQARLDSLTAHSRATAIFAAVVGRVFWKGAVMSLFRDPAVVTGIFDLSHQKMIEDLDVPLEELMRAELAFPRVGNVFSGENEFIFKHSMLRDVAYGLIPRKYWAQCHQLVARWLAERAGLDRSVSVANHYERGGELQKAVEYYTCAEDYVRSQGDVQEADELPKPVEHLSSHHSTNLKRI